MELIKAHIGTPVLIIEANWTDSTTRKFIGSRGIITGFTKHSEVGGFADISFENIRGSITFHYTELGKVMSFTQLKEFHNLHGVKVLRRNTIGTALTAIQKKQNS